ncbi:MAG: TolC family protein [Deltaproteobacteria bacterium]|nr:TolC family protein [Deltaproteobacteria bacterium]
MRPVPWTAGWAAASWLCATAAMAAPAAPSVVRCTLAQCFQRGLERSPLMAAARLGLDQYQSKLREAKSVFYPKFEVNGFASVLPALKPGRDGGEPLEDYDFTSLGPLAVGSIGMAQTIWTAGKVSSLKQLASEGVDIARATVRVAEDELRYQLGRAWWGLVLVEDLRELTGDVRRILDETRTRMEKQRDAGDEGFNQGDLLRLNVYAAEIEDKLRQNERAKQQALDGARLAMGESLDVAVEPVGELTPVAVPPLPIEAVEALALANSPRFLAQRGGVRARLLQVESAEAQLWPDLLFIVRVAGTYAPTRDSTGDSLASNPSNAATTGLGLVLRWTLDIWRQVEKIAQARLDLRQAQLTIEHERQKLKVDVRAAFREMTDARAMIDVQYKAFKSARGLLNATTQAWEDGFEDYAEVLRVTESYVRRRLAWAEAIHGYNLAAAALGRLCGTDLAAIKVALPVAAP